MAITLLDIDGKAVQVQAGEACNVVVKFQDLAGVAIVKANLISLTVTLFNKETAAVINARNAQNVLDANNGAVATDGTLTLRLGPLDNVMVGSPVVGALEHHIAKFTWTWNDSVAVRTGIEEVLIQVEKLAAPT